MDVSQIFWNNSRTFPLTGFVSVSVQATDDGSGGIMSTARPELSYPCKLGGK